MASVNGENFNLKLFNSLEMESKISVLDYCMSLRFILILMNVCRVRNRWFYLLSTPGHNPAWIPSARKNVNNDFGSVCRVKGENGNKKQSSLRCGSWFKSKLNLINIPMLTYLFVKHTRNAWIGHATPENLSECDYYQNNSTF